MAVPTPAEVITALQRKLPQLEEGAFVLVTVPAEDLTAVCVESVRLMEAAGRSGAYVCLSKDVMTVAASLSAAGVDPGRLRFVDAVSRMYGVAENGAANVAYVDGPLATDAIIDAVTSTLGEIKAPARYVLLDSLTALQLYGSVDATVRFAQTLQELLRREHVTGVVVVAYNDTLDEGLISPIVKSGGEIISTAS